MEKVENKTAIRVYIAGAMTGLPDNNRSSFYAAAEDLAKAGYFPLHVAMQPDGFSHDEYMIAAFAMLDTCHFLVLLPGWENSRGTKQEIKRAANKKMQILELSDLLEMDFEEAKEIYERILFEREIEKI